MVLIFYEIKLILSEWRKMAVCAVFLAAFCIAAWLAAVDAISGERLFEPFTIGVVLLDDSAEINLMVQMFNNSDGISDAVTLEIMDYETAVSRLNADLIPAFAVAPEGFTQSVITGENSPLKLAGNENRRIQLAVARLLINAGVAFIKTSQAGIYSTIDFAYQSGMTWDEIQASVVMPVNFEYMQALLAYRDYFTEETVTPTGNISAARYYGLSVLALLLGFFLVSVTGPLSAGTEQRILGRYWLCGVSTARTMLMKQLALAGVLALLLLPAAFIVGFGILAAAWLFAGLGLAAAVLFRKQLVSGLFLFTFSVVTAFVSGGILPLAYLPGIFRDAAVFMPHFWLLRIDTAAGVLMTLCFGTAFFILSAIKARV